MRAPGQRRPRWPGHRTVAQFPAGGSGGRKYPNMWLRDPSRWIRFRGERRHTFQRRGWICSSRRSTSRGRLGSAHGSHAIHAARLGEAMGPRRARGRGQGRARRPVEQDCVETPALKAPPSIACIRRNVGCDARPSGMTARLAVSPPAGASPGAAADERTVFGFPSEAHDARRGPAHDGAATRSPVAVWPQTNGAAIPSATEVTLKLAMIASRSGRTAARRRTKKRSQYLLAQPTASDTFPG